MFRSLEEIYDTRFSFLQLFFLSFFDFIPFKFKFISSFFFHFLVGHGSELKV
jgi:hypothetical protein